MRSSSRKGNADVARHELIGLGVEVRSAHAGWNGLSGTVVDETKHTFLVETASGSKLLVPKTGQEFVFRVGNGRVSGADGSPREDEARFVRIRGDEIRFRPEDRTKKVRG
jgi:ribonuclease P protein subunit POP4